MSQVYKVASKVIIWLGPEDDDSRTIREWLDAMKELLENMEDKERFMPRNTRYNKDIRFLVVRSTFFHPDTDPKYAPAARRFFNRPWFRRGWIVQEYLLANTTLFLVGDTELQFRDSQCSGSN